MKSARPPLPPLPRSPFLWKIWGRYALCVAATALLSAWGGPLPAAVAVGAAALGLAAYAAAPLRRAAAAARRIADGDLAARLPLGGRDEMADLYRALDETAEALRARVRTIAAERDEIRAILDGMVEGVVAVDDDERVIEMNGPAARLLAADRAAAVGARIWEVTRVLPVREALAAALQGSARTATEARIVDGTAERAGERIVEIRAAPLLDTRGRPRGAVAVLHDVTALRRLEAHRTEFVANASHELKTPLTAIRGLVETLLDDDLDAGARRRFLERLRAQADRLGSLVSDLLALQRIESRETPLARLRLDLRAPVAETVAAFSAAAARAGLAFSHRLPDAPVEVIGDHDALLRAASNLVENAIKYTPAGGRVEVRLRGEEGRAILEVEDDGIGIPPEDRARVFERFYRVDKARSRDLGGTGLGLSIVKHVALAHGGEVAALEGAGGRGSLFRLVLPLASS